MRASDRSGRAGALLVMPYGPVTPVYIAKRPIIVPVKVIIACYYLTGRLTLSPGQGRAKSLLLYGNGGGFVA